MRRVKVRSTPVRLWLVTALLALALALTPFPASMIDAVYSRGAFPLWQRLVTFITNLAPFAVLDVFLAVAAIALVFRLVHLVRVAFSGEVMNAVWEGARRLVRVGAVLTIVFLLSWGLNYRRVPLQSVVGPAPTPSAAALQATIADANALATRLRPRLNTSAEANLSFDVIAERLRDPMTQALSTVGRPALGTPGRPKVSRILTPFFHWAGVNGMVNPLALESVVDPGLLPMERPFVLAHEWAHLAGMADEAEASAVGWLACMKGGPALAYSASLYLIAEAAGALPPAARSAALAGLSDDVKRDLNAIANRALKQQRPRVQRAATKVYDEYLRANQVEDGAASYGRALTLILSPSLRAALTDYQGGARRP